MYKKKQINQKEEHTGQNVKEIEGFFETRLLLGRNKSSAIYTGVCVCVRARVRVYACACACSVVFDSLQPHGLQCRPLCSSVHGAFQARTLGRVAISFPRDLLGPGVKLASLVSPVLAGRFFTTAPPTDN